MSDIVKRLRNYPDYEVVLVYRTVLAEAADEIERLRKENELLRHDRNMIMGLYERQNERVIWLQEQIEDMQKEKA